MSSDQPTDPTISADLVAHVHGTYEPLGLPSDDRLGSVYSYGYTYDAVADGALTWTPSPLPAEPDVPLFVLLAQCLSR